MRVGGKKNKVEKGCFRTASQFKTSNQTESLGAEEADVQKA